MQREAAVVMAFFGRRANAMTKLNAVTGVQAFGVADKGLPAPQVDPFVQRCTDGRIPAPSLKLRRNNPRIVEDEAIALAQHCRQVTHHLVV